MGIELMSTIRRLFGRNSQPPESDDPTVIVPIPALVAILTRLELDKGLALTEAEVVEARDNAVCMTMQYSVATQIRDARGYDDLLLEDVWQSWLDHCESRGDPSINTQSQ